MQFHAWSLIPLKPPLYALLLAFFSYVASAMASFGFGTYSCFPVQAQLPLMHSPPKAHSFTHSAEEMHPCTKETVKCEHQN